MNAARITIVVLGVLLPFLARLPGGLEWLKQYTDGGVEGVLFLSAFNAPVWLGLLALTFVYRRPASLLIPCVLTFGFLAFAHFSMDLASDAQAAVGLVFIPVLAVPLLVVGGVVGYVVDRIRARQS